ncbi:MAG TPA: hypothetical protein VFO19_20605, partial [Vicinamibacterales bacterium]|nr:hypothetical protein [Vicinamibacterales bacterium]
MIAPVDSRVAVSRGGPSTALRLGSVLGPEAAEAAERRANVWIKRLRLARVDAATLRDRFTYRGDSMWWFGELFLHKQRTINGIYASIAAFEALVESPTPARVVLENGGDIVATIGAAVCARHGVTFEDGRGRQGRVRRALAARLTPARYTAGAYLKRRRVPAASPASHRPRVAAFVHSAFWREARHDDTYVGPVLQALAARLESPDFALIGVGPTSSFQRRDWRRRVGDLREAPPASLVPIEALAPADAIRASREIWITRRQAREALLASADLRDAASVDGYDAWPLVSRDLAGIADLQMPWSARAMDEAAAALDHLRPDVAVTYAEAGGWGRALTLEARRRGVPVAGIQHGFISRHWLNYLHEPDEIAASAANAADRGCPIVDRTLLYDEFARRHLERDGHYPPDRLQVVGNPRLDALVEAARRLTADDLARVRAEVGAPTGAHLVLLAAKRIPEF